ncbi:uncharacterized protein LOC103568855 [Microplitis demolitor]|uniref:uncharacterized protein LOC103568855 n=1 Tax=Microplitis demolitor TaxID=69319 RepID=UPI0004CCF9A3|nr:uncharacterized protein LOC103568855 [Microplitis demolitor]
MGIVSSTLMLVAAQLAWNCQRFLDPRYRYVEPIKTLEISSTPTTASAGVDDATNHQSVARVTDTLSSHQENRNRRAAQLRYRRKRPSSFDASLIAKSMIKNGIPVHTGSRVVSSTPSTLKRQQAPAWNNSSASISSSSSSISSSEDSDVELKVSREKTLERTRTQPENDEDNDNDINDQKYMMSAAEEAAFRMTVGRGHFSRSKKDRFLNHLRLEKRLNDLNREFFELTCRAHSRSLYRHHSGDLRKIV